MTNKKNNPMYFPQDVRDRVIPYARMLDRKASVSNFVVQCVEDILQMIQTAPQDRQTPPIVLKVDAVFRHIQDKEKLVTAAKSIVAPVVKEKSGSNPPPPGFATGGQSALKSQQPQAAVPAKGLQGSSKRRGVS